ncbi:Uu.00g122890.m01.CDS01 [Anthostomella pinea]|uniref:Uu.00g122890.m01.CDS01 n=1 Tax=Anthostomella pinea TaxID=933095 RepID=A0AAI8VHA2_9PEZI|nr:Uu.00g122890.m01.CDS01 [Anthostomella pinea]
MPREGTRSATGNSKPRVFNQVDTEPTIKRTTKPKTTKTASDVVASNAKAAKPVGVTKSKPAPKKNGVAAKTKATTKKVETKAKKAVGRPKAAAK